MDVRGVLLADHFFSSQHEGWGSLIADVIFSTYVNDIPTPSLHVELALFTNYTAAIAI
jgi:hypothetical protein